MAKVAAEWMPPTTIEWCPAGRSSINATLGNDPWSGFVVATAEDAARLDAQLQRLLAEAQAGTRSRPFIDFDHAGREAAAIPLRFLWDDGIRLEIEWTSAGRNAVAGRTYSYFSPEFILSDDGRPESLPSPGSIGSLVNTPAFQRIQRLAAANQTQQTSMNALLKAAVAKGFVPTGVEAEDAAADHFLKRVEASEKAEKENATLKAQLGELERKQEAAEEQRKIDAEEEVDAAIKAGSCHPDARDIIVKAILSDPEKGRTLFVKAGKPSNAVKGEKPVKADIGYGSLSEEEDRIQAASGKQRLILRAEAYNRSLRHLKAAQTIDAALVFSVMKDAVITVLGDALAPVGAFATNFGSNEIGPRRPITVTLANAGAALVDPTNFHQTNIQLAAITVTPVQISTPWGLTNENVQNGYRMMSAAQANAQQLALGVMARITALLTTANFSGPLTSKVSEYPDPGFALAFAALAKGRTRNLIVSPAIYAKAMFIPGGAAFVLGPDQNSAGVITGPRALGFDAIYYQTVFTGATALTQGFVCDPQAIACAAGIPIKPMELVPVQQSTVSIPSLPGLTVAMHISGDAASRSPYASYDIMFGAAVGDNTAGELIIPAAEV